MRVNMDSSMVSDPAFKLVARSLGIHIREVYGSCFLLWLACYERRSERLSVAEANACVDMERFAETLAECGLATIDGDDLVVHGVTKRIAFLEKQRERGSAGGRKSRAKTTTSKAKANATGGPQADAKQTLAGRTATAQAYSPAPALSPSPDQENTQAGGAAGQFSLTPTAQKTKTKPKRTPPPPKPMPWTVGEMLDVLAEASEGRITCEQFAADPQRWSAQLTKRIRELDAAGYGLDDVRAAARVVAGWKRPRPLNWLVQGGDFFALVADTSRGTGSGGGVAEM